LTIKEYKKAQTTREGKEQYMSVRVKNHKTGAQQGVLGST